jgi:hypothetical protein
MTDLRAQDYAARRARIVTQAASRWTGQDYIEYDDPIVAKAVIDAADATFRQIINDLDWVAATLRYLGYRGPTL